MTRLLLLNTPLDTDLDRFFGRLRHAQPSFSRGMMRLQAGHAGGVSAVLSFDDDGKLVRIQDGGEIWEYADFRWVEYVLCPFEVRSSIHGRILWTARIEQIAFDIPLDDAVFDVPPVNASEGCHSGLSTR